MHWTRDYPLISSHLTKECKRTFDEFANIHQVFEKLLETHGQQYTDDHGDTAKTANVR